jgi:hypothetical protein
MSIFSSQDEENMDVFASDCNLSGHEMRRKPGILLMRWCGGRGGKIIP